MSIIDFIKYKYTNIDEDILKNNKCSFCLIYLNPRTYIYYRKQLDKIECVDGVRFDGIFISWFIRRFIVKKKLFKEQSFDMSSVAPKVFEYSQDESKKLFIAGGDKDDIKKFISIIKDKYNNLILEGYCDGYNDNEAIVEEIVKSDADIVILGLGSIKQDQVAVQVTKRKKVLCFTCGAFISQTANSNNVQYYPEFIQKTHLRWLYRFFKEKGIFMRVIKYYPLFIVYFFKDYVNYKVGYLK